MRKLDIVDTPEEFSNANWGPYIVPDFYIDVGGQGRIPGGILIGQTNHWQWDLGGYDGNINEDRRVPWGYDSLQELGYNRAVHTAETWINAFRNTGIKVYYLETNDSKWLWNIRARNPTTGQLDGPSRSFNGQIVSCGLKWVQAYNYLIQKELLDPIGGKLYSIQPTEVAPTLASIFKSEATDKFSSTWSNDMWYSHLENINEQALPGFFQTEFDYRHLVVPDTAIVRNSNKLTGYEFQKRNYTKIVTGGWDKNNADDKRWAAVSNVTVEPSPEVNDDIVDGRGEVVARNIGDIDQTLKVIGEFLDDVFLSIDPMEHTGQVVFTASTETNPLGLGWRNVISSDEQDESFVWSGDDSLVGENGNLVPGIPKHHHNTTLVDNEAIPIGNVSIIGRPEGETVGGIAKVDTAERLPTASYGKREDTVHKIAGTGAALNGEGAYNGTVEYDAYEVSATQQRHNNMPLYYKVRAFVHD